MLFRSQRWPCELHITLAHFTAPLDRTPQLHYYWDNHVPWANVDPHDGLPRETPAAWAAGASSCQRPPSGSSSIVNLSWRRQPKPKPQIASAPSRRRSRPDTCSIGIPLIAR